MKNVTLHLWNNVESATFKQDSTTWFDDLSRLAARGETVHIERMGCAELSDYFNPDELVVVKRALAAFTAGKNLQATKIQTIKFFRDLVGIQRIGLKESKECVEEWMQECEKRNPDIPLTYNIQW